MQIANDFYLRYTRKIEAQSGVYRIDIWGKPSPADGSPKTLEELASINSNKPQYEGLINYYKSRQVDLFLLNQIHTDQYVKLENKLISSPEGDAFYTLLNNTGGGIKTADCIPILFVHETMPLAGGIHAGWRGLDLNIVTKTIRHLSGNEGFPKEGFLFYVGPFISGNCYEVQNDVYERFKPACFQEKPGGWLFDMKTALQIEFQQAGIEPEHIHWLDENTYQSESWYSHRCGETGRNVSVIYKTL